MFKTLLLLIAAFPAFAIGITQIDVEWNVTELASGNVLCSGSSHGTDFVDGLFCGGVIPDLNDIEIKAFASAGSGIIPNADAFVQFSTNGPFDASLYSVSVQASASAQSLSTVQVTGGIGAGLLQLSGFEAVGSTAGAQATASINVCNAVGGACIIETPFNFGDLIFLAATASAEGSGASGIQRGAQGTAGINISILDFDHNQIPGALLVPVPEPATWLMLVLPAVLLVKQRVRQYVLAKRG